MTPLNMRFLRLVRCIDRKPSGGYQGLGVVEVGSQCLKDTESQSGKIKRVLELDGSEGCTAMCHTELTMHKWL